MNLMRLILVCFAFHLGHYGYSQTADTLSVPQGIVLSDSLLADSSKKTEVKVVLADSIAKPVVEELNSPDVKSLKNMNNNSSDSLYTKFLTVSAGYTTILNDRNDSVSFWKSGYTIGFGFGDRILSWLAYSFSIDLATYKYDNSAYLDYYSSRLNTMLNNDPLIYTPEDRAQKSDSINALIKQSAETNTAFANEYASRTKNNLHTAQIGAQFIFKPIKIGKVTPYVSLGGNVLFTLTTVTLIKPTVNKQSFASGEERGEIKNQRVPFFNNSTDGSISLLTGLGAEYDISNRFKAFVDVRKTWADASRVVGYGKLQWDILTVRAGIMLKIK